MNQIIHNCTHKDTDSATTRVSEDQMFIAIFNYIEHLFSKIKPKKLFFMAVDGVAPRAKMNQQRSRRFRTALDAEIARNKAIHEGIELPKEPPFDSNCITPGTLFMAKLSKHLRYFVNKKVSEDEDWQGVEVVLSGHEVPGEGEHKIMEYIRQAKAQKNYDPNMRHCLYGLDADLIMLGLLSHDPHFCLLREEVTFGRQAKSKSSELEHQNFFLMHLCLVREYLELEFAELKAPRALPFAFDMERVIDDFILMAFFVGNDFLPNLPHLHINEGALALMFGVYKAVLPRAGGYINDGGVINVQRLGLLLDELSHTEFRFFERENQDQKWFKSKQMGREDVMERAGRKGIPSTMTRNQHVLFKEVERYVGGHKRAAPLDFPTSLPARDRKFVGELADSLRLQWSTIEDDDGNRHIRLSFPPTEEGSDSDETDDEEAQLALKRVLKQISKAKVVDVSAEDAQAEAERQYEMQFQKWKNSYYTEKFGWDMSNQQEMKALAESYVRGLQWVLYYYYRGIASWPWFYAYHYSPMISDVKLGLGADLNFALGQPFLPYQQLMGVLPDRSKSIVPTAYWELMTEKTSPIIDFYPRDFELDMNGKKMEWEAVVKIPFIDEKRLLDAMATKDHLLAEDERQRNSFGVTIKFTHAADLDFVYQSSLPGVFPDLGHCHCVENIFELPTMDGLEVFVGLMDGALLGVNALAGFPSLNTLPIGGALDFHGVMVFQQESRQQSMVLTLLKPEDRSKAAVAKAKLGTSVFVGYPFLQEAKVVKVSDELFDYVDDPNNPGKPAQIPHQPRQIEDWRRQADRIEKTYSKKLGIVIAEVESLLHVEMLKGLLKTDDGATMKEYGLIEGHDTDFAAQTVVDGVVNEDPRFLEEEAKPIEEEFPIDSKQFFLGDYAYGRPVRVTSYEDGKLNVMVVALKERELEFGRAIVSRVERDSRYTPSFAVAKNLNLHPLALSKITSSLSVESGGLRLNLGLNLKFESKKLKVLGYSRKGRTGWEYSPKATQLLIDYMTKFPEFIAGISSRPSGDIYKDTDFYQQSVAAAKMKEIVQWLKSVETKSFVQVPLDADQLDSDVVMEIERQGEALSQKLQSNQDLRVLNKVPRHALLSPADAEKRLGSQRFSLGDRIVYARSTGKVPIALRGTVVGITRLARQTWLDIVFDTTFMAGTSLGERCSPFRGASVLSSAVLNLSDRQVIATSRASEARRQPAHAQPLTVAGYGAPMGAGGRGQSFPAGAPPPLQGSYRAAARGGMNGNGYAPTRGRGNGPAPWRNGAAGVQNGNGAGHSLPFRPKENVPPAGGATRGVRFADAANGGRSARGGRGGIGSSARGGAPAANQKGSTVVDSDDPSMGVRENGGGGARGTHATRSYRAVPPPVSLGGTAPSPRARGRGGAGGRGGRGGGRGRAAAAAAAAPAAAPAPAAAGGNGGNGSS
jgi:5'-3' exoribonuclease 1